MKRLLWCLLILLPSICTCFAGLGDADDGELTLGEYDYDVQLDNYDELLIKGGGGTASRQEVTAMSKCNIPQRH